MTGEAALTVAYAVVAVIVFGAALWDGISAYPGCDNAIDGAGALFFSLVVGVCWPFFAAMIAVFWLPGWALSEASRRVRGVS